VRILIDIGHPAHVHYFRNLAKNLIAKGWDVLFTTRDKEVTLALLDHYGFQYVNFGTPFRGRVGKVWGLFWFSLRLFITALRFKPDYFLNATMYSAIVAWLLGKPHFSLEDTFNMEQVRLYLPFTTAVFTGTYPHTRLGAKEIHFSGYQELAYLHPRHFTPDPHIAQSSGWDLSKKHVILRLVSWTASHDFGHAGISLSNKRKLIAELSKQAELWISAEGELPEEFDKFRLKTSPERIHDVLACCSLLIGESFTMASECAMLGVPAIVIHNTRSFYLQDQEKRYGLVFNFSESLEDQDRAIARALALLSKADLKEEWQRRRNRMLSDCIDPSAFFVWFIENFPESLSIIKEQPDFQLKFK
jgi:predicted glycosyltransferase